MTYLNSDEYLAAREAVAQRYGRGELTPQEVIAEIDALREQRSEGAESAVEAVQAVPVRRIAPKALAALRAGLMALDDERERLYQSGDAEGLAWGGSDLVTVIRDLQAIERLLRANLADLMDKARTGRAAPRLEVQGLGTVEVWGGKDRHDWESLRLLHLLVLRSLYDEQGVPKFHDGLGLDMRDIADAVVEVLVDCLPLTGSLQWRVGSWDGKQPGLRKYGLDPEDFCVETDRPRLARIPKRQE